MSSKVLIVDDESVIRTILVDWLQEAGYETWTASNGQEGLQKLQDHHPDLVISDVWMPEMDGYDFCRAVRNTSDASIIMMTGVPQEAAVLQEKKLDIDDYVIKPIEMVDFMRLIEEILNKGQTSGASTAKDSPRPEAQAKAQDDHRDALTEKRLLELYRTLPDQDRALLQKMAERLLDDS